MRQLVIVVAVLGVLHPTASVFAQPAADQFQRAKLMVNTGDKPAATDVILRLEGDRFIVRSKAGGADLKTFPYSDIKAAEYSYSKGPR